jgi:hypothetical protein
MASAGIVPHKGEARRSLRSPAAQTHWSMVPAPAAIEKVHAAMLKALALPDVRDALARQAAQLQPE